MRFLEYLEYIDSICEEVFIDDEGNQLDEAAKRAFKKKGKEVKRYFRCTAGPKAGKLVSTPQACAIRKDPKKVRHGRKVARTKKGIRILKSRLSKRTALSKRVSKLNKRLEGN